MLKWLIITLISLPGLITYTLSTALAAPPKTNAVIFMYHHFGVSKHPQTNVSLAQFEAHLVHLQQQAYTILPLKDIISRLNQGQALPERTIAITIDDAYLSVYTEAWPRLQQHGWPFTVFVSTESIDKHLPAFMSWQQMREMQTQGVDFANHSRHHDYLIRRHRNENQQQWLQRIQGDIDYAQQRLKRELGNAPMLFAYPYGEYTMALKKLVKNLGYSAFTQQSGAINLSSDRQLLPRYPMAAQFAQIDHFILKAATLRLPVSKAWPEEPVTHQRQPILEITLNPEEIAYIQLNQLSCFISGQGKASIQWLDKIRFTLRANTPLSIGRNRYNCTAPAKNSDRYYWFSRLWIIQ